MKKTYIEDIENEIIRQIDNKGNVYIESGSANDSIDSYLVVTHKKHCWQEYEDKDIIFNTSACIFPEKIKLTDYDKVETEFFKGNLFVKVY